MSQFVFLEQAAPICQPIAGAADHEWQTAVYKKKKKKTTDAIDITFMYMGHSFVDWIGSNLFEL